MNCSIGCVRSTLVTAEVRRKYSWKEWFYTCLRFGNYVFCKSITNAFHAKILANGDSIFVRERKTCSVMAPNTTDVIAARLFFCNIWNANCGELLANLLVVMKWVRNFMLFATVNFLGIIFSWILFQVKETTIVGSVPVNVQSFETCVRPLVYMTPSLEFLIFVQIHLLFLQGLLTGIPGLESDHHPLAK